MAEASSVPNDSGAKIGITFAGESPHVFVYRIWEKQPGATKFTRICDGNTVDEIPDHIAVGPFPDGTIIAWWTSASGKKNSFFRFSVIFAQNDKVPAGGNITLEGTTSAKGGAVVEHQAVLV